MWCKTRQNTGDMAETRLEVACDGHVTEIKFGLVRQPPRTCDERQRFFLDTPAPRQIYILTNSEHTNLLTERMKLVSVEPGPFLVASFLFASIIGLTACGGGLVRSLPNPPHRLRLAAANSPRPVTPPIPPAEGGPGRCVPYLIPIEVQPADV
jgi:hypothetical protein